MAYDPDPTPSEIRSYGSDDSDSSDDNGDDNDAGVRDNPNFGGTGDAADPPAPSSGGGGGNDPLADAPDPSGVCERCGDTVLHGGGDRFQLRAYDFSESSASWFEGALCSACWDDLVRFMREDQDQQCPARDGTRRCQP